jgi:hypothetical protein
MVPSSQTMDIAVPNSLRKPSTAEVGAINAALQSMETSVANAQNAVWGNCTDPNSYNMGANIAQEVTTSPTPYTYYPSAIPDTTVPTAPAVVPLNGSGTVPTVPAAPAQSTSQGVAVPMSTSSTGMSGIIPWADQLTSDVTAQASSSGMSIWDWIQAHPWWSLLLLAAGVVLLSEDGKEQKQKGGKR